MMTKCYILVVYSSPLSGQTYNLDLASTWRFNSRLGNHLLQVHPSKWISNRHSKPGGSSTANNNETTTTEQPTSVSPSNGSYSRQIGHKKINVKWSFDFNHDGSATTSTIKANSTEKPIKADQVESKDDASEENNIPSMM